MTLTSFWKAFAETWSAVFYYSIFNWRTFFGLPLWGKLMSFIASMLFLLILFVISIEVNLFNLYGALPDIRQSEKQVPLASEMYSADGKLIAKYFTENRSPVEFNEIAPSVVDCLIATEDIRFYKHQGIDFMALFSAVWSSLRGDPRGGSTITQQLVKNIFKTRRSPEGLLSNVPIFRTITPKLKEWMMAVKLEHRYTKQEILTMYLNTVDFGSNAFGIRTAARTYFNALPDQLNMQESATLIGLLKATSFYSPIRNPKNARERRNVVLGQLKKYEYINKKQHDSLIRMPLVLRKPSRESVGNLVPYFRGAAAKFLEKWCQENKLNLYTDGLKIYTTIDTRLQEHAEQAVNTHMKRLQERFYWHWAEHYQSPFEVFKRNDTASAKMPQDWFVVDILKRNPRYDALIQQDLSRPFQLMEKLNQPKSMRIFTWEGERDTLMSLVDSVKYHLQILQTGLMTINPHNGYVKAWVGGINYEHFNYDHVMQSKRQPGSTFKPFVYTEAIEQGKAPCDTELDAPVIINYEEDGEQKSWSPHNSDYQYAGMVTLRKAMGSSKNTVTARLTEKITPDAVRKRANLMGINSEMKAVPSIGLGSNLVSLYEMVGAYATFMNGGEWIEPVFITHIKDRHSKTIYEAKPQKRRAMREETAFLMTDMLRAGIQEQGGTSQALWEYADLFTDNNEIGGKTGTSSNYADGWYMGVTKDLVTGVWIGADEPRIRFRSPEIGEASQTALPLYGIYMQMVYEDKRLGITKGKYPEPKIKIEKPYGCTTAYIYKPKPENVPVDEREE